MESRKLNFVLNSNTFPIEFDFDLLDKINISIKKTMFWDHIYYVSSKISNEVFQSFLNYWTHNKEPLICYENFSEYQELNKEFDLENMDELLKRKEKELEISDLINIDSIKNEKIQDKSEYEKIIARNLDYYITKHGKKLIECLIISLINIFNHLERKLTNFNYAYELITKYCETSNDIDKLILLQFLDITQLNKKNYNDSISPEKLKLHCSMMPNINIQYLGTILKEIAQFKQEKEDLIHLKETSMNLMNKINDDAKAMKNEVKIFLENQIKYQSSLTDEVTKKLSESNSKILMIEDYKNKIQNDLLNRLASVEKIVNEILEQINSLKQDNEKLKADLRCIRCLKYEVKQLKKQSVIVQQTDAPSIQVDLQQKINSLLEDHEKLKKDLMCLHCLKYEVKQLKKKSIAIQQTDASFIPIDLQQRINSLFEDHEKFKKDLMCLHCLKYEVKQLKKQPVAVQQAFATIQKSAIETYTPNIPYDLLDRLASVEKIVNETQEQINFLKQDNEKLKADLRCIRCLKYEVKQLKK